MAFFRHFSEFLFGWEVDHPNERQRLFCCEHDWEAGTVKLGDRPESVGLESRDLTLLLPAGRPGRAAVLVVGIGVGVPVTPVMLMYSE